MFHSSRHAFKRMARDVGIGEESHDCPLPDIRGWRRVGITGEGIGVKALAPAPAKIASAAGGKGLFGQCDINPRLRHGADQVELDPGFGTKG